MKLVTSLCTPQWSHKYSPSSFLQRAGERKEETNKIGAKEYSEQGGKWKSGGRKKQRKVKKY
jgi:hypothetical protein